MAERSSAEPKPEAANEPLPRQDVAPDCEGMNFYEIDGSFRGLLPLYAPADLLRHLTPHFQRLGALAGGRLDRLARAADRHPPILHARDRFGRDEDWIEYHSAYREMEEIAFADFGLHAMSHRAGVLGWPAPIPPVGKYAMQYLFVQAEFGLMCPVSVSDTSAHLIRRYGAKPLRERLLPRMLSQDLDRLWKGTQFITEKTGGSDVGAIETVARRHGDGWRLFGEKWFCSHADADIALLLARPEGGAAGTRGLGLFAMPRRHADGTRNRYRIVRLKDKLGTRSMASGEIVIDGALAYQVGDIEAGFKQMLDQVNLSRLSHGVRAAAMMRRCLNEAMTVAGHRRAFGRPIVDFPLLRRQLGKIMVPTEQALSMFLFTAGVMAEADEGDRDAKTLLRILTPLIKFRACRDNIRVATAAMEVRGGNGYIEDWVNARLVRDAHIGVLWEGTSNINALDAVMRAVGKSAAETLLRRRLQSVLKAQPAISDARRRRLLEALDRAGELAREVAAAPGRERHARVAASALYNAASACLLASEGASLGAQGHDARRLLLAELVLAHRLTASDPLAPADDAAPLDRLLDPAPVPLAEVDQI